MNFVKIALLIVAVVLGGCATTGTVRLGSAYAPVPTVDVDLKKEGGQMTDLSVRARGLTPEKAAELESRAEAAKSACVHGVEKDRVRMKTRPNPSVSKKYRSLYAVGHGIPEQHVLVDMTVDIDCKELPKPPKNKKNK